jgi:hypothetical protein
MDDGELAGRWSPAGGFGPAALLLYAHDGSAATARYQFAKAVSKYKTNEHERDPPGSIEASCAATAWRRQGQET